MIKKFLKKLFKKKPRDIGERTAPREYCKHGYRLGLCKYGD